MQYIIKGNEPNELIEYKKTPGIGFDNLDKEVSLAIKQALLQEQGYICCYCGKRIGLNSNTILEHILCRVNHKDLELSYDNILASCDGGQSDRRGKTKRDKKCFPSHCDDKKSNKVIALTPVCKDCEKKFAYDEDGEIYGITPEAKETITVLGLDCRTIKNRRKAAIEAYKLYLETLAMTDEESTLFWKQKLSFNSTRSSDGEYPEYCFAVRYYIEKYCLRT